jgi:hypothetical protein
LRLAGLAVSRRQAHRPRRRRACPQDDRSSLLCSIGAGRGRSHQHGRSIASLAATLGVFEAGDVARPLECGIVSQRHLDPPLAGGAGR